WGRGGSGKRAGERQQVHSLLAAGNGHTPTDDWCSIRGDGIMKTKKNFPVRPNGAARDSRSGTANSGHRSDSEERASKRTRILIVEDDPAMVGGLRDNFEYEVYEVISASDGVAGLECALADDPDLVVLDVMMPRMSGLDVCKQLKAKRPQVPIIMLTARGQEIDKVVGLELGADDYVTKPFSVRELMARVKAVLRRVSAPTAAQEIYKFSDIEVNIRQNAVVRDGTPIELSAQEL